MKKNIVVYYSRTGSNKYLAEKIAKELTCDLDVIKPRVNIFFFLLLASIAKIRMGFKALTHNIDEYDCIILCGPIWMGQLISPLRDFINKYRKSARGVYFVTCCGTSDAIKDKKFGHAKVFLRVQNLLGNKCIHCEAFPIGLVLPGDKKEDSDAIMKTRLSDDNFTGEIQKRLEKFIQRVTE